MPRQVTAAVATLGIDIGKNVFHLIGQNDGGAIVLRLRLSRAQVRVRLANMPPCLVGMEACASVRIISAANSRRPVDGRQICVAVFKRAEKRLPRRRNDRRGRAASDYEIQIG
jgi:transposase